jgi:hypothetical protein
VPEGDRRQAAELRAVRDGVPPRRAHALPFAKDRACLASAAYDVEAFGGCWYRTYSDVEGLEEQCLQCPGDKNYTLVKVVLSRRTLCL